MAASGHLRRVWGSLVLVLLLSVSLTSAVAASEVDQAAGSGASPAMVPAGALSEPVLSQSDLLALTGGLLALTFAVVVAVTGRRYQLRRGGA